MNSALLIKKMTIILSAIGLLGCQLYQPLRPALQENTSTQKKQRASKEKRMHAFQVRHTQGNVFIHHFPKPIKGMKWTYRIKDWDTRVNQFKRYSDEVLTLKILDDSNGRIKAIMQGWDNQVFTVSEDKFWPEIIARLSWDYFDGPFQTREYCPGITPFWCEKNVTVPSGTFNARPILSSNMSNPGTWKPYTPLKKSGDVMIQMDLNPAVGLIKFKERSRGEGEWVWMMELVNYSAPMKSKF